MQLQLTWHNCLMSTTVDISLSQEKCLIMQVTLQLVRVEQRKLGADVAELKRTVTKSQKKMDSIEKDVRQVKGWVEELRRQPLREKGSIL